MQVGCATLSTARSCAAQPRSSSASRSHRLARPSMRRACILPKKKCNPCMLSHCSFLGTALYGYVALALRAKQWEDGSIMPVTVRGARGGMTRALWLRMYAAACPGHARTATEHGRWHWEGWIHLPNAEGMCVCVGFRSERGAAGVCCRRIGQSAPSIKNKKIA